MASHCSGDTTVAAHIGSPCNPGKSRAMASFIMITLSADYIAANTAHPLTDSP